MSVLYLIICLEYKKHPVTGAFESHGIKQLMELIKEEFPDLKYGYFNPPMERIRGDYETDFAH